MGELLQLLLKSLCHVDLNIFIQPSSNISETWRPHTHGHHMMKQIWTVWMMNHMSAHTGCQVPNSTGVAWMGMIVQHYILHEQAKHSPDCMWMPSRVPHQHCSMTVISESFNTQQAKDFRFKLDKDAKAAVVQSLQQQPRELFMEVIHQLSVGWMTASMPMGTI